LPFRGPREGIWVSDQKIGLLPRMSEVNGTFGEVRRVDCIRGAESGAVAVADWLSLSSRATPTRVRVV